MELSEAIALTPEEARRRRTFIKGEQVAFFNTLKFLYKAGLEAKPDEAIAFLNDFDILAKKYTGRPTVDPKELHELRSKHNVTEIDAYFLARLLGRENSDLDARFRGKKLLLSLSRAGLIEATVFVVGNAHVQAKKKPSILKSSEIAYSRAHLELVANKALDFRAMVLEGKVAQTLGNTERAISLWTRAMDHAVAAAKKEEREKREGKRLSIPAHWAQQSADQMQLLSPWIELMLVHYERSRNGNSAEMQKCRRAMDIGCALDDPTSHFYAATFTKRIDEQGNHIVTSTWLYHMLKAASSGHQKACHEIALFYAQSGWKYIEDEPPDHVKPTPFDSYPASSKATSMLDNIKELLGLKQSPQPDPKDTIFQSAVFPSTAADRFKAALHWLENPTYYYYAPSFLFKAKMHMQETLWAGANAPPSALHLRTERYSHASQADYDSNTPIPQTDSPADPPPDPPNPLYSLDEAKLALREVFHAYEANAQIEQARVALKRRRQTSKGPVDEDEALVQHSWKFPPRLRKWFTYPEVREMYESELDGLYGEAKGICDDMGWDMYDDEGGLLYKAKRRKVGGAEAGNSEDGAAAAVASSG